MPFAATLRRHPWRWGVGAIVALLLIVLLGGSLYVRALLQPQRFTELLQQRLAAAGLTLSVDAPAMPELWPHPAVQLQGFRLSNTSAATPLLQAGEARLVLSWRSLLHRETAVERMEIDAPRIDLDQLRVLITHLPQGTGGAPALPQIGAGVRIRNGILLRGNAPLLLDFDLDTGALQSGQLFSLVARARDADDHVLNLDLRTVPKQNADALDFAALALDFGAAGGAHGKIAGDANWSGGAQWQADLRGALSLPAFAPAKSASSADKTNAPQPMPRDYALQLRTQPARDDRPMSIAFKLDGADEHIDAQFAPLELVGWWQHLADTPPNQPLALPPLQGHLRAMRLDFGAVQMQGLDIEAGPDVAPLDARSATAGSAAAPAKPRR